MRIFDSVKQTKTTDMNSFYNNIQSILDSQATTKEKVSALYEGQSRHAATKHISPAAWFAYLRAIKGLQD
jgi:hypothetical protein